MKGRRIKDQRVQPWPKCWESGDIYVLKARCLPSLRAALIDHYIVKTLYRFWAASIVLLVWDALFVPMGLLSFIDFLRLDQSYLIAFVLIAPILHISDLSTRRGLQALIFGKTIRIEFTPDTIRIRGLKRKHRYERNQHMGFACSHLNNAQTAEYRDSKIVELVIENLRSVTLFECYDPQKAMNIVANCNYLNAMGGQNHDFEIDSRDQFRPH